MYRKLAIAAAALILLGGGGTLLARRASDEDPPGLRSGVFDPPREAPDFELDGSRGKKLKVSDFRGKVVILEFGFTFCTQVCPVTLSNLVEVEKQLGPKASEVQLVFVTVDPKRDTPQRLNEFLTAFHPSFLGATGDPPLLERMREAYGVLANEVVFPNSESGYEHSSFIYLLDRTGKIRTLVPFGTKPKHIVHDIEHLLGER
jgi:protein SCO1/2